MSKTKKKSADNDPNEMTVNEKIALDNM